MKFSIITFGCKVNQYESNMMKENMLHHNFSYEEDLALADIVLINTCTVTNTADNKCLKTIRRVKREYPEKILVVAGCSVQNNLETYEKLGIDVLIGNTSKASIGSLVWEYVLKQERIAYIEKKRHLAFEDMFIHDFNHVRAFIKIEDGCDNFCSYCIIPFVRGSVRSKDFAKVISEAKTLANNGHQEIVLTGIHTGHYQSGDYDLTDLIHELSKIDNIKRIRLSSIEITELTPKFMEELQNNPKLCNHLHIPLQSGSDFILKKMNRKYDLAYYANIIAKLRSIRPSIAITSDIIVGHPYETDEYFLETLAFSQEMNFAKIHVFPYSKRNNTAAAKMPEQVSESIKKERVKKLMALSQELEKKYYDNFLNKEVEILIEEVKNNKSYGHTDNYLYVELDEVLDVGKIYKRCL